MTELQFQFENAHAILKESVGKYYNIYASSYSGKDYLVTSGVIEKVELDYTDDILVVYLEGHKFPERFSLKSLKNVFIENDDSVKIIKPIYKDDSYFKIYINKRRND